jgi:hypothetical protein
MTRAASNTSGTSGGAAGNAGRGGGPQAGTPLPAPMSGLDSGVPAQSGDSRLARVGDACQARGRGACEEIGGTRVLICDGTRWADDGECSTGSVCGYTHDNPLRCVPQLAECRGQQAGSLVCVGSLASACSPDLTQITVVQDCVEPKETCQAGKCVCVQACGSACPDLMSDPQHCGECDHVCAGACADGLCEPLRLTATGPSPFALAVDAEAVYWTEIVSGAVKKVALSGGSATTLATVKTAADLVVDAQNVYVIGELGLFSVPHAGGNGTMLLPNDVNTGSNLAIDGAWLYTANPNITKLPVTGGTPTVLASQQYARSLVFSAGVLYWPAFNGSVTKISANGGTTTTLYSGTEMSVGAIAVDKNHIYWFDEPRSTIVRVPISGGSPSDFASNTTCSSMVSDGTNLYWTDNRNPGSVLKQSVSGTSASALAAKRPAFALTQDAKNLYWLEASGTDSGMIMKLPK